MFTMITVSPAISGSSVLKLIRLVVMTRLTFLLMRTGAQSRRTIETVVSINDVVNETWRGWMQFTRW